MYFRFVDSLGAPMLRAMAGGRHCGEVPAWLADATAAKFRPSHPGLIRTTMDPTEFRAIPS